MHTLSRVERSWSAKTARLLMAAPTNSAIYPDSEPDEPDTSPPNPTYPPGELWRSVFVHAVRQELEAGANSGRRYLRIDYPGLDAIAVYEYPTVESEAGELTLIEMTGVFAGGHPMSPERLADRLGLRLLYVPPHACTSLFTGHIMHSLLHSPEFRARVLLHNSLGTKPPCSLTVDRRYPYLSILRPYPGPDVASSQKTFSLIPVSTMAERLLKEIPSVSATQSSAASACAIAVQRQASLPSSALPSDSTPTEVSTLAATATSETPMGQQDVDMPGAPISAALDRTGDLVLENQPVDTMPADLSSSSSVAHCPELPTGLVDVVFAFVADAAGLLRVFESTAVQGREDAEMLLDATPTADPALIEPSIDCAGSAAIQDVDKGFLDGADASPGAPADKATAAALGEITSGSSTFGVDMSDARGAQLASKDQCSSEDVSGQFDDAPEDPSLDCSLSTIDSAFSPRTPSAPTPPCAQGRKFQVKSRLSLTTFSPSTTFSSPTVASLSRTTFRRSLDLSALYSSPTRSGAQKNAWMSLMAVTEREGGGSQVRDGRVGGGSEAPKDGFRPRGFSRVIPRWRP